MNTPPIARPSRQVLAALIVAALLAAPSVFAARNGGGQMGAGAKKAPPAPSPDTVLKDKYDKNKNGKIDLDELKVIHDTDMTLFTELMKFDADHNNIIDASELTKWADSKKTKTPAGGAAGAGGGGGGGGQGGGGGGG